MPKIVVYQTASVWFVKNEYFMVKIDVCLSLLPSDRVIGWDIKMTSHPNSNASFINIWDRLIWQRSPNLTRSSKLAAAPNWSVLPKNFHGSSGICPMDFINSIQNCEISHQTFRRSHASEMSDMSDDFREHWDIPIIIWHQKHWFVTVLWKINCP